ncbi:DNA-binding protein [Marinobacter sp.]|uniref:DNA-binding protein n=1 Tax=Marinobacter sp. TaxID=50741 RepID=UPI003A9149D7
MNVEIESSSKIVLPALSPGRWVRPNLLLVLFGINAEQARKYRDRGFWLENKHWRFDPIRRVVYNPTEIENWFEGKL